MEKVWIRTEQQGEFFYYQKDERQSVTALWDQTGRIETCFSYDEYGVLRNPEAIAMGDTIPAYTGHLYEVSTGLYYAKARYYAPEQGRFLSADPYLGEAQTPATKNRYSYG